VEYIVYNTERQEESCGIRWKQHARGNLKHGIYHSAAELKLRVYPDLKKYRLDDMRDLRFLLQ
jgi:hypothetical protein